MTGLKKEYYGVEVGAKIQAYFMARPGSSGVIERGEEQHDNRLNPYTLLLKEHAAGLYQDKAYLAMSMDIRESGTLPGAKWYALSGPRMHHR